MYIRFALCVVISLAYVASARTGTIVIWIYLPSWFPNPVIQIYFFLQLTKDNAVAFLHLLHLLRLLRSFRDPLAHPGPLAPLGRLDVMVFLDVPVSKDSPVTMGILGPQDPLGPLVLLEFPVLRNRAVVKVFLNLPSLLNVHSVF